jgi:Undecaprenyl-phosphate galactose phosphotransferase WbaP
VNSEARVSTFSLAQQPHVRDTLHSSAAQRVLDWAASVIRANLRVLILQIVDFTGVAIAGLAAVGSHVLMTSDITPWSSWKLWPVSLLVVGFNLCFGLYRGGLINSAQELRRYTLSSGAMTAGSLLAMPVFDDPPYTTQVLVGTWIVSLLTVPVLRVAARLLFSSRSWWGQTAVIFGAGKSGRMVVDLLLNQPGLGVRPVAMIDDAPHGEWQWRGVPIVTPVEMTPAVANKFKTQHAIVAMTGTSRKRLMALLQSKPFRFARVTVIPDPFDFSSMWLSAYGVRDTVAAHARPVVVRATAYMVKRTLDILGVVVLGVLALPLIAIIALGVKLDSRGPVIFGHRRIGQRGREFRAWKFRSMVTNADDVLRDHLQNNPQAMAEWNSKRKLRDDPRVTAIGRFLRKTSLDELPQLWNVLIGEMSLVGPRPIVHAERHHYREQIALYEGVLPGLSGLWQVSGRSNTSYEERVRLDSYYVRNWSIWLDLCILVRTIPALLFGRGAC